MPEASLRGSRAATMTTAAEEKEKGGGRRGGGSNVVEGYQLMGVLLSKMRTVNQSISKIAGR